MYSLTRSALPVKPTLTVIPCPKMFVASAILLALASQAFSTPIQPRQSFAGDTENGLSGPCKAYTVIFARGTTETGNVGAIAGPPFFQALASRVGSGNLAVQGVNYPADIAGFLAGGDPAGSQTMYGHQPSHWICSRPANISRGAGRRWCSRRSRSARAPRLSCRVTRRAASLCITPPRSCRLR